jgi:hypothetical protein
MRVHVDVFGARRSCRRCQRRAKMPPRGGCRLRAVELAVIVDLFDVMLARSLAVHFFHVAPGGASVFWSQKIFPPREPRASEKSARRRGKRAECRQSPLISRARLRDGRAFRARLSKFFKCQLKCQIRRGLIYKHVVVSLPWIIS